MAKAKKFIPCSIARLTPKQAMLAAERAREENPARWPSEITPAFLTVNVKKWWGDKGRKFTVAFASGASQQTRARILEHANAWSAFANVSFVEGSVDPDIRIAFGATGYWSYLGVDVLGIPDNQPTMNLQGFQSSMPESEWKRVVRHEFGHTLGFEHEHMRQELVAKLDVNKTIAYFRQTQGWSAAEVRAQVLTPLSQASIRGTPLADDTSIMCYQLPGSITTDGKPIRGGNDINKLDAEFIATIYPRTVVPPPPPPPVGGLPDQFTGVCDIAGVKYGVAFTKQ
jgi:hypothetical protein